MDPRALSRYAHYVTFLGRTVAWRGHGISMGSYGNVMAVSWPSYDADKEIMTHFMRV